MKTTLSLPTGFLSWTTARKKIVLLVAILTPIFLQESFAQKMPVFLSQNDSCIVHPSPTISFARRATSENALVRVAYLIPSNRTPQPDGVVNLQQAIQTGQQWFQDQMEQNGFGPKTFVFETEADGVTPMIHVVGISETDEFLREDIWSRTIQSAQDAGVSVWASGEIWVLIPETHLMMNDGSITPGAALGAGSGSANDPGVALLTSESLPFLKPEYLVNDASYDGNVLQALGPFEMKQDITFPWFEGNSFSSVASSKLGALLHEIGHAFGLAHDYRNDNNFHGNLMFNGLRGIRGSLFPEKYPQDYTRLEYASALILSVSHYFNDDKNVTSPPFIDFFIPPFPTPQQGHVRIEFKASDPDSLSVAQLRYSGDVVAEMKLYGKKVDTAFVAPYFTQGTANPYQIWIHDTQGNSTFTGIHVDMAAGFNQAPIPFIKLGPAMPLVNQSITLDALQSNDIDDELSSVLVEWDINNDGGYDTEPTTVKLAHYQYEEGGNYLIRARLTDPDGTQSVSTPVSIRIPGEKKVAVESFTLINSEEDTLITKINNGIVIDLLEWDDEKFSIRANTSLGMIDRVEFDLTGPINHHQVEKKQPYTLFGDVVNGSVSTRKFLEGEYILTATPFSASGQEKSLTITFKVVAGSVQSSVVTDKTIGGSGWDSFQSIIATNDGGYMLAGYSASDASGDKSENSNGLEDFWIVRLNSQYQKIWDKTYGTEFNDEAVSILAAHDGGYLVAGHSAADIFGNEFDYWIVKIDEDGNKLWENTIGGTGRDLLRVAVAIPGGGYLLAGDSEANASRDKSENSKGESDYWVVKIDNKGNKIWDKTIGGAAIDELGGIISTLDGGWILGGISLSDASGDKSDNSKGESDYWIVKIDSEGNKVWDKTIGGDDHDSFRRGVAAADGGYLLGGSSYSDASGDKTEDSNGDSDLWVVHINSQGKIQWDKTIGGNHRDALSSIIQTPDLGYLLGGISDSDISGDKTENGKGSDDYWVIKLDTDGNKVWDKTIGGSDADELVEIISTSNGQYLLTGSSTSNISGDKSENAKGDCDEDGSSCFFDYWIVELKTPTRPVVTSLSLMNANIDREINELKDGEVINLSELECKLLNIRANVSGERIEKVSFDLKGPVAHQSVEKLFPYALFGDSQGNFSGRALRPGDYSLTVKTHTQGTILSTLTISFTVINEASISGFTLIDATTDQPVRELTEGDVIDLSLFKDHKLSVRADTKSKKPDKVTLKLQGPVTYTRTEILFPYALFGDVTDRNGRTDYNGMKLYPGTYKLTAIPFLNGIKGVANTINFTVKKKNASDISCKVEVYPVPATHVVNIKYTGNKEHAYIMIMDANGNVLLQKPISRDPVDQLDVTAFPKGVHYLKVVNDNGTKTFRLIVE